MRSRSVNDLSQIRLIFERGTNIMDARQLVQERVDLVAPNLPTWAAPLSLLLPVSPFSQAVAAPLPKAFAGAVSAPYIPQSEPSVKSGSFAVSWWV